MTRRLRLLIPGIPLHITQRGHNRRPCFHMVSDYLVYLDRLSSIAHATGCSLHAYVLMTNHIHLLTSFSDIQQAPVFVKLLAQQYSAYFNRRLKRTGTVWEGRYFSCPVPAEAYFMICQRYIEHNPVRAGMVETPQGYEWSSYHGNAGMLENSVLTPHDIYLRLGLTDSERHLNYRALSEQALCLEKITDLRTATRSNRLPGELPPPGGRPKKLRR